MQIRQACLSAGFIQELNTSKPLYEALIDAVDSFEDASMGRGSDSGTLPGGLLPTRHGQQMACLCHAVADICSCPSLPRTRSKMANHQGSPLPTSTVSHLRLGKRNILRELTLFGAGLGLPDGISSEKEADHQAEALWVAAGLRRDFEAAGINLPGSRREEADKLTAGIERLRMLIGT